MGAGLSNYGVTATTTSQTQGLPRRCYAVMIRTPSANTDNVRIVLDSAIATVGDMIIAANASVTIDLATKILLKQQLGELTEQDFIRAISFRSDSGSQTVFITALDMTS